MSREEYGRAGAPARPLAAPRPSFRRLVPRSFPDWGYRLLGIVAVLGILELLARSGAIPSRYFPPVSEVFRELGEQLGESSFWAAVGHTVQGWGIGLAIAAALAIPIGIVIGSSTVAYRSVRMLIEFLRPIPSVALVPLAVLVYGTGLESTLFLVVFASFWQLLIQTIYGVQDVDPVAMDTARAFGLGRVARLVRVTLPSAVPYIATGLRLASAVALILAVTAELVIGSDGLGRSINLAREGGAVTLTYALIVATGLLGWGLNSIFSLGERRVLHWHQAYRPVEATA